MRPTLFIAVLLGLAFGLGQAMRSLPHACDAAHAPHELALGANGEVHAHCEVCDFAALPFDRASQVADRLILVPCADIGVPAIPSALVPEASLRAARGPPQA